MSRPTILVLGMPALTDETSSWGLDRIPGHAFSLVPNACVDRLRRLGCAVAVLTSAGDEPEIDDALDGVAGLVLLGGEDVEAARWGGTEADCVTPNPARDAFEFAVVERAVVRRLPTLGICRGAQLLNVALGGTLLPHLEPEGHGPHLSDDGGLLRHPIDVDPRFAEAAGWPRTLEVASGHHQAIDQIAPPLRAVARDRHGILEAVVADDPLVLAVQWHPEFMSDADEAAWAPFAWLAGRVGASAARAPIPAGLTS